MNAFAGYIEYYLPVFIPLFLTIISVLAGIVTKRIQLTLTSLLRIHSDIVLGLFSFVIWALVAYQQTGAIHLNQDYQLSLIRVVLLLFANIILLIAGLIVLNVNWGDVGSPLLARQPIRYGNTANGLFLGVTLVGVFAPIVLAAPIVKPSVATSTPPARFAVAIPYADASLSKQVGPARWAGRLLCQVASVSATDRQAAVERAVAEFQASGRAVQLFGKDVSSIEIVVDRSRVVVEHLK